MEPEGLNLLLLLLLTANRFLPGGSVLQCKTGQYDTIRCNTVRYNTIQFNRTHHTKSHTTLKATLSTQNYKKNKNKYCTLPRFRNELNLK